MVSIPPDRRGKAGLWNRLVRWLPGLALVFVLAGCTLEQDVRIGTDQEWSADYLMEMPAETAEMMGGVEELRTSVEQEQPEAEGYDMTVQIEERGDNVAIIGEASGTGFDKLNEAVFENGATITPGEGDQVSISHYYGASDMGAMGESMKVIVRIAGSEIVNSNADRVEGSTAIWENPDQIDVTLVGGAALGGGGNLIGGILAGVVAFVLVLGLAIGGMMWFQKKGSAGGSSEAPSSS